MELGKLSAMELGRKIRAGEVSVPEAAAEVLKQIEEKEKICHCYITMDPEEVMKRAVLLQERIRRGEAESSLAGVPVAVKDNICTAGIRTTCGSRMLEAFVPSYSAAAAERLEQAGLLLIGKTNMDEFGMGSTTETSAYGSTGHPLDPKRSPGGSSGGSAAAVAAGECFCALGSDTGGSVRQPAAHCGIVGMKPTYGLVSRYGLVAYASSMDQIGPMTKTVEDCAGLLEVIAGHDSSDATSARVERRKYTDTLEGSLRGRKIGILEEEGGSPVQQEIREAIAGAADFFRGEGAQVERAAFGMSGYAVPTYYTIACAEAGSNLARFDGVKYGRRSTDCDSIYTLYQKSRQEGFGSEVKRRIMLGSFVLSEGQYEAYYLQAMKLRQKISRQLLELVQQFDLVLMPSAPSTAPLLGESLQHRLSMYEGDSHTVGANLAGLPAISVPWGRDRQGLPIGIQLMAGRFQEQTLLQAAWALEQGQRG